jgi:hypothetical protein
MIAADGVARTRLGDEVLVKRTMDDLLAQDSPRMTVNDDEPSLKGAATGSCTGEAFVIDVRRTPRA